jgi:hypothetical protein
VWLLHSQGPCSRLSLGPTWFPQYHGEIRRAGMHCGVVNVPFANNSSWRVRKGLVRVNAEAT